MRLEDIERQSQSKDSALRVTHLRLREDISTKKDRERLEAALERFPNLTQLILSNCKLDVLGLAAISRALVKLRPYYLTHLDLSENRFNYSNDASWFPTDEPKERAKTSAAILAKLLPELPHLVSINLIDTFIMSDFEGACTLVNALSQCRYLTDIGYNNPPREQYFENIWSISPVAEGFFSTSLRFKQATSIRPCIAANHGDRHDFFEQIRNRSPLDQDILDKSERQEKFMRQALDKKYELYQSFGHHIWEGNIKEAAKLIKQGVVPFTTYNFHFPPINSGTKTNYDIGGYSTPLIIAVCSGRIETVRWLLSLYPNYPALYELVGENPWSLLKDTASLKNALDIAKRLKHDDIATLLSSKYPAAFGYHDDSISVSQGKIETKHSKPQENQILPPKQQTSVNELQRQETKETKEEKPLMIAVQRKQPKTAQPPATSSALSTISVSQTNTEQKLNPKSETTPTKGKALPQKNIKQDHPNTVNTTSSFFTARQSSSSKSAPDSTNQLAIPTATPIQAELPASEEKITPEEQKAMTKLSTDLRQCLEKLPTLATQKEVEQIKNQLDQQQAQLLNAKTKNLLEGSQQALSTALEQGRASFIKAQQQCFIAKLPAVHAYYLALQLYLNQLYMVCNNVAANQFKLKETIFMEISKIAARSIPVISGAIELLLSGIQGALDETIRQRANHFISLSTGATAAEQLFETCARYFVLVRYQTLLDRINCQPGFTDRISQWLQELRREIFSSAENAPWQLALWKEVKQEGEKLFKAVIEGQCKIRPTMPPTEQVKILLEILAVTPEEIAVINRKYQSPASPAPLSPSSIISTEPSATMADVEKIKEHLTKLQQQVAAFLNQQKTVTPEQINRLAADLDNQRNTIQRLQRSRQTSNYTHFSATQIALSDDNGQMQLQLSAVDFVRPNEKVKTIEINLQRILNQISQLTVAVAELQESNEKEEKMIFSNNPSKKTFDDIQKQQRHLQQQYTELLQQHHALLELHAQTSAKNVELERRIVNLEQTAQRKDTEWERRLAALEASMVQPSMNKTAPLFQLKH